VQLYRQAYTDLLAGSRPQFQEVPSERLARFLEVGEAFGITMHIKALLEVPLPQEHERDPRRYQALEIFRGTSTCSSQPSTKTLD
jgi:hypothetical protein